MTQPLRFGIIRNNILSWDETVAQWQRFEAAGFDSVWNCDHFQRPSDPGGPHMDAWMVLAGVAACTSRIRIGVLVSSNTFRHPALLAKQAVTVDHISNGRLELGIGTGWFKLRARLVRPRVPRGEGVGRSVRGSRRDHRSADAPGCHDLRRALLPVEGGAVPSGSRPETASAPHPRRPRTAHAAHRRQTRRPLELLRRVEEMRPATKRSTAPAPRSAATPERSSAPSTAGRRSSAPTHGNRLPYSTTSSPATGQRVSTSSSWNRQRRSMGERWSASRPTSSRGCATAESACLLGDEQRHAVQPSRLDATLRTRSA